MSLFDICPQPCPLPTPPPYPTHTLTHPHPWLIGWHPVQEGAQQLKSARSVSSIAALFNTVGKAAKAASSVSGEPWKATSTQRVDPRVEVRLRSRFHLPYVTHTVLNRDVCAPRVPCQMKARSDAATAAGMRVFSRIVRTAEGVELAKQANLLDNISDALEASPADSVVSQVTTHCSLAAFL